MWTKCVPNTCNPPRHPFTSSPPTTLTPQFSLPARTLLLKEELCCYYWGREGKVRPSPLLCLLLSFLSSVPPSQPRLLWLPPSSVFAFDIQQLVQWVSRDEGGTHARRWTFDPSTQWPCLCRLGSSSDIQLCFSLDNKTPRLCPGPE